MTGQHVQGLLLIEAARQMMLCVSESYLPGENTGARYYVVLNSVYTGYLKFAFPLPTLLSNEILSRQPGKGGSLKATCQTRFFQGDLLHRISNCGEQIEASMSAMSEVLKAGAIRAAGLSEDVPWRVKVCADASRETTRILFTRHHAVPGGYTSERPIRQFRVKVRVEHGPSDREIRECGHPGDISYRRIGVSPADRFATSRKRLAQEQRRCGKPTDAICKQQERLAGL
jgi:hypothetical protein